MNEEKRIPFNLKMLQTCLPDYFQGFGGPVIAFPVDASMTYSELVEKLTDDDAWPENADIEDIRSAVVDLVGNVHSQGTRPYFDVGPDEPPSTHFVSHHPTMSDMWMVIDKEDGEVMSSWPTEIEANIAAWGETGDERPADVYAYFGIELDCPDGYRVDIHANGQWAWQEIDSLQGTEKWQEFYTEMEAKVSAWKHHLSNSEPTEFVEGDIFKNEENVWEMGINHNKAEKCPGNVWHNRIEVYGADEEETCELRDRIIKGLNQ